MMNSVALRIGGAASALMMVGMLAVPSSLAAGCTITDNGNKSHNSCEINITNKTKVVNVNKTKVSNSVGIFSSTGGNNASGNVGGGVTVVSGNSTVSVSISNNVNGGTPSP